MTDLTDEQLRAACEAAGLTVIQDGESWAIVVPGGRAAEPTELSPHEPDERAWIESRCASLLVARVREMEAAEADRDLDMELMATSHRISCVATDAQRIRAAMAVLEGEQ